MEYPNRSQRPTRGRDPRSRRYGRWVGGSARTQRSGQRGGSSPRAQTSRPLLVRQEAAESDGIVEIQDERDNIEITTELSTDSQDGASDSGNEENVSREDVDVSLNGMELRIRATPGEKPSPGEERETCRDAFERRISLTRSVVVERADVSCEGSTLTITLPKTVPA